jgi:hypothetical protein
MGIAKKVAQKYQEDGRLARHLKRRTMTRTEKKRAKNQRIAMNKGQAKLHKKIKDTAKVWANILTKSKDPNEDNWNRLFLCGTCHLHGCFAYGGGRLWCRECTWENSCLKRLEPIEPLLHIECQECIWERRDNENTVSMW